MPKLIEVQAAKEFASTFLADPILKMAVNAVLDNAPTVKDINVPSWIPVTERLPDEFISVLVCIPAETPLPTVKEAYLANNWWTTKFGVFNPNEVTHWMPMPEPPKGK